MAASSGHQLLSFSTGTGCWRGTGQGWEHIRACWARSPLPRPAERCFYLLRAPVRGEHVLVLALLCLSFWANTLDASYCAGEVIERREQPPVFGLRLLGSAGKQKVC